MARRTDDEDTTAPEVIRPASAYSQDVIAGIVSFDDALAAASAVHGDVQSSQGFRIASEHDKAALLGLPMVLMEWYFLAGDYGNEYVEANVVVQYADKSTGKWTLRDGSTGMRAELRAYTDSTKKTGGLVCPAGLRASTFYVHPKTMQPVKRNDVESVLAQFGTANVKTATTYYLDIKS